MTDPTYYQRIAEYEQRIRDLRRNVERFRNRNMPASAYKAEAQLRELQSEMYAIKYERDAVTKL
jgi:predicted  nucleic acid-binding Zn-ribbon protein